MDGGSARSLRVNVALMRAFRRSPMDFLDVLVASGAGTIPLRMGPERVLLVDDATQVWELLTTHARRTGKGRGLVRARLLLGEGLLTSEGEKHLRHRRALQPAFHPQRIADYLIALRPRRAARRRPVVRRWRHRPGRGDVGHDAGRRRGGAVRLRPPRASAADHPRADHSAGGLPARHGSRGSHAAPLPAAGRDSGALSQGRARKRRRRPHTRALGR